jgi:hypothetical protein
MANGIMDRHAATARPLERRDLEPALDALDRALGDQSDYGDLVEASRRLVALRDMLIAERRRGTPDPEHRLERLNTILSLVVAAEYPLEGARHERVATARQELAALA